MPASPALDGSIAAAAAVQAVGHTGIILPMPLDHWIDQALYFAYRWADYALLNLMDDPALLALVFC
jgi:hypothetical protein